MHIPVLFTSTVGDLIREIKNCSLFIGNDSGPLHIANFLGKPTYAIFGPTSVEFPYIPNFYHRYINKTLNCSPNGTQYCFTKGGLFCPAYECMHQLTFEEVKKDVLNFIDALGLRKN
jgi:ADP-heptose:LPS heptosyltransferase